MQKGQTFARPQLNSATQVEVQDLGHFAYRENGADGASLHIVDDDTPCVISLYPKGGIGAESLLPLARDLVRTATPQVVQRKTLEGVVWVVDPPDDPLARWQREGASVTAILTLPQGFPKPAELPARVAQGKPRKALVLAYLQHGSMFESNLEALHPFLPQITVERFPAEGRPTTTPQALLNLGLMKTATVQQEQRLAVAFANSGQKTARRSITTRLLPFPMARGEMSTAPGRPSSARGRPGVSSAGREEPLRPSRPDARLRSSPSWPRQRGR